MLKLIEITAEGCMNELISWLKSFDPMAQKTVVMPNKNFHFELRKAMAIDGALKYLFNCRLTTPTGFIAEELYGLSGGSLVSFQDIMYSFKVCLAEGHLDKLQYFDTGQLKDGLGYAESFARTILELDMALVAPEDLRSIKAKLDSDQIKRIQDVGLIWEKVNKIVLGDKIHSYSQAIQLIGDKKFEDVFWMDFAHGKRMVHTEGIVIDSSVKTPEELNLEEWASLEEEDRASIYWITEKMKMGLRLDQIAIITPAPRPGLIDYINHYFGKEIVYAPKGAPSSKVGISANIRHLVEAVRENLPGRMMPRVFKMLKANGSFEPPKTKKLAQGIRFSFMPYSENSWAEVITKTGCVGGNRASSKGISDWEERIFKYWPEAGAYREGIALLVKLANLKQTDESLTEIAGTLIELVRNHFYMNKQDQVLVELFLDEVKKGAQKPWAREVKGEEALSFIVEMLDSLKVPCGKLGDPAIFVGTLENAVGLELNAVRFVGLQEGSFPATPKQDPIMPDVLREIVSKDLKTAGERLHHEMDYFNHLISCGEVQLSLSVYGQNIDGTEKSYSGLFLDLLDRSGVEGNLRDVLKESISKSKKKIYQLADGQPFFEFSKLASIRRNPGEGVQRIPHRLESLKPALMEILGNSHSGFYAGALGLDLSETLSPSMIGSLLTCPRKYFYEQILQFEDVSSVLEVGEVDAMNRGTMIHWIIEKIDKDMGFVDLGNRPAPERKRIVSSFIDACLEEFPVSNFFGSEEALEQQREDFEKIVNEVISNDTKLGVVEVTAEKKIGIKLGELSFRGKIDRIEKHKNGKVRIVDFKSGRGFGKSREDNPFDPGYDIQLLLYMKGLIQGGELKEEVIEALEFRYPESEELDARLFSGDDLASLLDLGKDWFEFIELAYSSQSFPACPSESNCKFCPFLDVCDKKVFNPDESRFGQLYREICLNHKGGDDE